MNGELVRNYAAFEDAGDLPLRVFAYAAIIFSTLLALVLVGDTEIAVYLAPFLLAAAAFVVWRCNQDRKYSRLITLFFALAVVHSLFGYWAASNSTGVIWIGSNAEQMFHRSLFVIATTLLAAAFAYDIGLRYPPKRAQRFCVRLDISEHKLIVVARRLLILGCLLETFVIVAAGFMPILTSDPGVSRYLSPDLTNKYKEFEWILYLALDLLACTMPIVLFSGLVNRKNLDRLLALAGFLGVIVTLRRSYLISLIAVLLLTVAFVKGKFPRRYAAYLALLVLSYFASQLILLNTIGEPLNDKTATSATLSGLPEVRDLGWVMSLMRDKRLYGATFVSLVPLLGRVSDFKSEYGLVETTTQLIGLDGMAMTGGLRITVGGEGFLNFGAVGCLFMGAIFGYLCSRLSHLNEVLMKKRDLASSYLAASLFLWLCFWFYLAGTEATGAVRNGLMLIVVMFYLARVRSDGRPIAPAANPELQS
jgi:oligosaccharide repeat unit polymerase